MADWGGYGAIAREAAVVAENATAGASVACPRCGTLLDVNARGEANCPMGHYRRSMGGGRRS